jgi:signal recognition particle subunit SRP54
MAKKFADQEDFTLDDFLAQMQQIRKMGSMKKMLMMMPGAAGMREQLENFDEREIDRVEAIVRSMTPHERVAPKIINGSRRARIAKGSGVTVSEVNQLMERFAQAQKMMKRLAQGKGVPGMPAGIPGMPGAAGGGAKKGKGKAAAKKSGSRSGNPAKRAQENAALEQQRKQKAPTGAAFGSGAQELDPADLNLPKGFEKFLGK